MIKKYLRAQVNSLACIKMARAHLRAIKIASSETHLPKIMILE